jgi:DNA primase
MSAYWQAEARFDWKSYVEEKGGAVSIRGRRDEYLLGCPDCGKPKLAVNIARRTWRCFTCADGGYDAASLIIKVDKVMWKDAIAMVMAGHQRPIGRIDKIDAPKPEVPERAANWVPQAMRWPDGCVPVATTASQIGHQGRQYCQERGIPDYVQNEMALRVCDRGRFQGRLIFPVFDSAGNLIFFQGRAMWKPRPNERHIKILSPQREDNAAGPSDCLLNLQYLVGRGNCTRVLVVEGPVDCTHAWPDAVATFGKRISPRQMELLMRAGVRELDLCYDADAIEDMLRVAPLLSAIFRLRIVRLPPGKDPGELSKEQIEVYRAGALEWGGGERLMQL